MKRALLVALVLAASVSLVTSIIRGETVGIHSHPHLVIVQYSANGQVKQCGGSIISQNWILTSASCMFDTTVQREPRTTYSPSNVTVTRGYKRNHHRKFGSIFEFRVAEIIPHSLFTDTRVNEVNHFKYNLGLVRLESSINFASDVNMVKFAGPNDQYSSSECVVAGWNKPSSWLHQVNVALQSELIELIEIFSSRLVTNQTDVGYPVLCSTSSGDKIQVAVVAGNTQRYSLFASVSLEYKWIQQYLSGMATSPSVLVSSGSLQRPPMHQHSGSHQRLPSNIRPGSPAVNRTHLVIVSFVRNGRRKQCGGSIITENYVLTSARCMFNSTRSREPFEKYLPSEVTISSDYRENDRGQFKPIYESKALKIIPQRKYLLMDDPKIMSKYDIGLIRLETPIDFEQFPNLGPVKLTSLPNQYQKNRCVIEHFNERYHIHRIYVELDESQDIYSSPVIFETRYQGYPIMCPNISSNQMIQVAVVANASRQLSKFPKISFNYVWLQNQLNSVFNEEPNNSMHSHLVMVSFGKDSKRCSGSLIHRYLVLTAAHCFYSFSGEMFKVNQTKVYGGFYINNTNKNILGAYHLKGVSQFILYANYQNDSPERARYDIGLVRLKRRTSNENHMTPISLADSVDKFDLSRCLWAGWPIAFSAEIVILNTSLELSEAKSPRIFTSRPVFGLNNAQNQGGPVLCPLKSKPDHLEQVAVAIDTNHNVSRYIEVPFHLPWILPKIRP